MAQEFSRQFYNSKEWQQCREYCLKRDNNTCTNCGAPAEEVHHKIKLTAGNIWDTNITLNPDNMTCLCRNCHFAEHVKDKAEGHRKTDNTMPQYVFDSNGYIVPAESV